MAEVKFDYDDKNDNLFLIDKSADIKSSVMFGDVILDISKDGKLIGIEMFDASNMVGVSRDELENIRKADMQVFYKLNMVIVRIHLHFRDSEKDISIPIATEMQLASAVA
ncbi:MAG: DUF2283 domain-containing protein [archaeon]